MAKIMVDIIVIGAGLGGLMAGAKLAAGGLKVCVLEKKALPGGTSYVFRRKGYAFPMGPLSFSFPGRVRSFLSQAGIETPIAFKRSEFELKIPSLDIQMSLPLKDIGRELGRLFPGDRDGIDKFIDELKAAIRLSGDMDLWHPDFRTDPDGAASVLPDERSDETRIEKLRALQNTPASRTLDGLIADRTVKNFLGSMGTGRPEMSMLNLASMWNVMSEEGIWFPLGGVHGIADLLRERILEKGGEIRLSTPVEKILVKNGRAVAVRTGDGQIQECRWVISNADYKTTFLDLLEPELLSAEENQFVRETPYTSSELCVYLGVRPDLLDLEALRVDHLFYQKEEKSVGEIDLEDFDHREFEICDWSRKAPHLAPPGKKALILRVGFPYEYFSDWRTGEKSRREGYSEFKMHLAEKLILTAESVLPGLSQAIELIESATPLTYRDWGNRRGGSIAGWSWAAHASVRIPRKLLIRTPVPGLLTAGIYAASELFLGGVPTALYTGSLAADLILEEEK